MVIERHGDGALTFVWRNEGALTVTTVLTAFVDDPEPSHEPRLGSAIGADERVIEEPVEPVVGPQERLDALAQLRIDRALSVQDRDAVRGVMVVGGLQEDGLHALWVECHGSWIRSVTSSRVHPLSAIARRSRRKKM